MGIFSKKSPKNRLQKKYEKLLKESFELSKVDRSKSDAKQVEADKVLKELEALD